MYLMPHFFKNVLSNTESETYSFSNFGLIDGGSSVNTEEIQKYVNKSIGLKIGTNLRTPTVQELSKSGCRLTNKF